MGRRSIVFSLSMAIAAVGCGPRSESVEGPGVTTAAAAGTGQVPRVESRPEPVLEEEPIPLAPGPSRVLVTVRYADGSLSGPVEDREVRVGDRSLKLSRLRRWQRGDAEELMPDDGEPIEGKVDGLDPIEMTIGGRPRRLDLAHATAIDFECRNGLMPTPRLEALVQHNFTPPSPSRSPTTYYRAIRPSAGSKVEDREILHVMEGTIGREQGRPSNGFTFDYKAEKNLRTNYQLYFTTLVRPIEIGKPYDAARSSGLGKFVVWELEEGGNGPYPIKRLAIDYYFKNEEVGVVRYHSSFK
jgi:hypothetical protein